MNLPQISLRRPVTVLMFYLGIVLLGMIAFREIPVDFLPPMQIPRLTVQTSYPNTSPSEVEDNITEPIESGIGTVAGVKKVLSVSREGLSLVTVEFYWGTDMDFAVLNVREKLDQLRPTLPQDASRPTILRIDPSTEPVMKVVLSTRGIDRFKHASGTPARWTDDAYGNGELVELKETARALVKRRLEQIDGVAQASVTGGLEREIHVELDPKKLREYGLTIPKVSQILASANLSLPGGSIKQGLFRYSLRTVGEFSRPEEIGQVVVAQTPLGRPITIRDIGVVRDSFRERLGLTRYNGSEVIALQVRKEAGANTIEVSKRIHAVIEQLRTEYPNLTIDVVADQAEFIGKSIVDVEQAILIGAMLAFLVLFLFLRNIKYPLVIGLTIPVSILATLVAMYFLGITLNIISLTGLALGIGMLGDNAIIVIENVTRYRERGMSMGEAALKGAQEINVAVTASTLTNVAIFLPIIFVEGVASKLFLDMGVTMTISLLVSLLVAATLVPMLVSREGFLSSLSAQIRQRLIPKRIALRTVPGSGRSRSFSEVVSVISERSYALMDTYLAWSLRHRTVVMLGILALFLVSVLLAFSIPSEPAPDIDQSRFVLEVRMPKGTMLDGTVRFTRVLEDEFLGYEAVRGVYSAIGLTDENLPGISSESSVEGARLEIRVDEGSETSVILNRVRRRLEEMSSQHAGIEFAVRPRGTTFEQIIRPDVNDVKLRISGPDMVQSQVVAKQLAEIVKKIRGIADVRTSLQLGGPEYAFSVDREKAVRYGLTLQDVAQHIAHVVKGQEATFLTDFDRKVTIRVKQGRDTNSLREILESLVPTKFGYAPVGEFVTWERRDSFAEIWRENGQRAVVVVANVAGRPVGWVVDEIQTAIEQFPLPSGYTVSVGGENEEIADSFRSLLMIIVLSIVLVYMILASEYESILYPLVILLTSPLAFIGAISAMAIAGQAYNVMSLIGLVIMIGAVDNDAVIAVDVITGLRRQGKTVIESIKEGMKLRLRPILMTTATTVLGIIPLLFEFGAGSELVRSLTAPLVGGLIASTVFTVLVLPVMYTFVDRFDLGRDGLR